MSEQPSQVIARGQLALPPMNMSQDEEMMAFVDIECQDPHLNILSDKLTKCASKVGTCLGLDEESIKEIEKTGRDKPHMILKALTAWVEKMREGEKAPTWGELMKCLSTLHEDPSVMTSIKRYLQESYDSDSTSGMLLIL